MLQHTHIEKVRQTDTHTHTVCAAAVLGHCDVRGTLYNVPVDLSVARNGYAGQVSVAMVLGTVKCVDKLRTKPVS